MTPSTNSSLHALKTAWRYAWLLLPWMAATPAAVCHGEEDLLPYRNSQLPVEARVADLMDRMSLEEKVGQMCQYVGIKHGRDDRYATVQSIRESDNRTFYPDISIDAMAELIRSGRISSILHAADLDEIQFLQRAASESRLGIPLLFGIDASHGHAMYRGATVFPTLIGLASSWNPSMLQEIGTATAREMSATGYHWTFSVNLSVSRDARWGRVGETFGEDPLLIAELGAALTRGYQADPPGSSRVISCANYFVGSSAPINGTNFAPVEISERTMREVYLPPYRRCIQAGVFTVMAAHNDINGIPCHANPRLYMDLLRDELGFKGFVVSDWNDVSRLHTLHRVADSQREACRMAVMSGIDMNMHGPGFFEHVVSLVRDHQIPPQRIDDAVERILRAKFAVGLFDDPDSPREAPTLFNSAHRKLALDSARQSIVLLKNDGVLPLAPATRSILVTGPNAHSESILGDWTLDQPDENVTTVLEGVQALAGPRGVTVEFVDCGSDVTSLPAQAIATAAKAAPTHDLALLVLGENSLRYGSTPRTCGENFDRDSLALPGNQLDLVQAIVATGTPTVVVLVNGRPLALPWIYQHVPGIVEAWEPGLLGGQAIADILFGEINPSGKLPITIPRSIGQNPAFYNHKPSQYYRQYAGVETGPIYPFGYGLSYTTFTYSELQLRVADRTRLQIQCEVTNTGSVKGTEIVQCYVSDRFASVSPAVKKLHGFQRLELNPGETQTVEFSVPVAAYSFVDPKLQLTVEPGLVDVMIGPHSDLLQSVAAEITRDLTFRPLN